jgi:hypothetical protein
MIPCRCCGVIQVGLRAELRRCVLCDSCDRRHGLEREALVMALFAVGRLNMWEAIGQLAIDDAHHAGMLMFRGTRDSADLWVPRPVPRWAVVIGRALARQEQPAAGDVVAAMMQRYVPGPASALPELRAELTAALQAFDPDVLGVEVTCERDVLDPGHMLINILHRTAAGPEVEIPTDIGRRPRGQA